MVLMPARFTFGARAESKLMNAPADGPDAPRTSVLEPAASEPAPVAAFASPLWGRVADRRGRKLMVLRSCFAIALFTGLMSLVGNVWQFAGLRALMGVFAGFNAATISLVASQVPPWRLGYSLGWLSTGQLVGTLVGPLLGGFVADVSGSCRAPFVLTAGVCALCGVVALVLVRERFTPPQADARRATLLQSVAVLSRAPGLLPLFVVLLLAQFGVQAVQPAAGSVRSRARWRWTCRSPPAPSRARSAAWPGTCAVSRTGWRSTPPQRGRGGRRFSARSC